SSILQHSWSERVRENVERFVKIGAGVLRGDAGPEANSLMRNGGIIDWRNPKPAASQLMTEPIHPFAIADDNRHDVGCRSSGVDAETAQLSVKVIGVLP